MFDSSKEGKSQNVARISLSLTLLLKSTIIQKKKNHVCFETPLSYISNTFNKAISNHMKLLIL